MRGCIRPAVAIRSREGVRDVLEGAVLQQAGEEDVAGLDEREVLLVLGAALRQQPGRLEVEQGRGDEQELGGLAQVPPPGLACSTLMCAMKSSVTRGQRRSR